MIKLKVLVAHHLVYRPLNAIKSFLFCVSYSHLDSDITYSHRWYTNMYRFALLFSKMRDNVRGKLLAIDFDNDLGIF